MTDSDQFGAAELSGVERVIGSQVLWRGNGPVWSPMPSSAAAAVDRFEDAFAAWLGVPFAHAVNSGTSANEAAAWSLRLPPGSEVLCPSASPVFVPMAILAVGCIPVFVDVDPATMLLDPERLPAALSDDTRAIVALHLWGRPAPMDAIMTFAAAHGLLVMEDCAQAPASTLGGRRLGTFGDAACFSLQQTKLVSAGEGGVVTTRDRAGYARSVLYSNTGIPSFRHGVTVEDADAERDGILSFGHNHRMSELQAAVALAQLERVDDLIAGRARAVQHLHEAIAELDDPAVSVLDPIPDSVVSYWRLPVRVADGRGDYVGIPPAEPLFAEMERRRTTPFGRALPPRVHYAGSAFPGAEAGARRTRVLPVTPFMSEDDARRTVAGRLRSS